MGKRSRTRYTAGQFIKAIPGSGGIITEIARRVGCNRNTAASWIDNSPTVRAAFEQEREAMLDMAEATIFTSIRAGNAGDAKWFLTRLGRHRGYGDQLEVSGTQTIILDWGDDGPGDDTD